MKSVPVSHNKYSIYYPILLITFIFSLLNYHFTVMATSNLSWKETEQQSQQSDIYSKFKYISSKLTNDRVPTDLPDHIVYSFNGHGRMRPLPNAHLVQLDGSPYERGVAHGYLLTSQIIDWLVFYQFRYNMNGNITYFNQYREWLNLNQNIPYKYEEEAKGMMDGMLKSGKSIYIEDFNRDFDILDIYIINSYLEGSITKGAMNLGPFASSNPMKQEDQEQKQEKYPACTQFVAWGYLTANGQTLAGRNMDGETDPTYVTVNHLIVFAITPSTMSELRYISIMWPGHIGTLSAMNEDGVSIMLNCGTMGPGPVATNVTSIEWTIRDVISSSKATDSSPMNIFDKLNRYKCSEGGVSAAGSVLVISRPVQSSSSFDSENPPGFIAELDRFGGLIRTAPSSIPAVYESNHFIEYGVNNSQESDPTNPERNFGQSIGFSSRWRLQAVRVVIESLNRTSGRSRIMDLVSDSGVPRVMRAASHGATEHSIAFAPNGIHSKDTIDDGSISGPVFSLTNAQPWKTQGQWDAPYNQWIQYRFEEMFEML